MKNKKILIIKLSSIGDCLLATPAIESIRKGYPESFITWLVEDKSMDIALLNPYVDEVVVVDKKNFKIGDYISLIRRLRKKRYDISIDLQGVDRTVIFAFLSGAKKRFVKEYAKLGFLNNGIIVRKGRQPEHAVDFYLFLAEKSGGAKLSDIKTTLLTSDEDKDFASKFLFQNFNDNLSNLFIGINPSGSWKTKRWPIKYFSILAERLISELNANILIFGGKGDEYLADEILKEVNASGKLSDHIKSVAGETTLKQARELLARMTYFVTPDSGLMHIAAGIENLKTIALFGPTNPLLTGPFNKSSVVLQDNLNCIPCFKKECPLNKIEKSESKECVLCMKRISHKTVFDLIAGDVEKSLKKTAEPLK